MGIVSDVAIGPVAAPTALATCAHARCLQRQAQRDQRFQVVPQHGISLRVHPVSRAGR
jgi:hypothetical protein